MERIFSPAAVDDLLAAPTARGDLSVLNGHAVLAVDCSAVPPDPRTLAALRNLPVVTIGVGEWHEAFDVIVDDEGELPALSTAIAANPQASVTLAQLLRMGDTLSPLDALVAESLAYATLQSGAEFARWLAGRGARVRRPEAEPPVLVTRAGDLLRVVLNRPRVHNLYNAAMRDALVEALVVAAADPHLHVEITGSGTVALCRRRLGGVRFGERPGHGALSSGRPPTPRPTCCARRPNLGVVQGACVGAGAEIAAFAGPRAGVGGRVLPTARGVDGADPRRRRHCLDRRPHRPPAHGVDGPHRSARRCPYRTSGTHRGFG